MEILVTAPPALKREVVSTKVSAEQARSIPGAQGDVVRVVENLPGVARSAVGSGQLVVWGAGPEDTRTYVDGVPIPRLYHEGGLRSTVHSSMVSAVELVPGGYGSAYGRGLGGLVRIDSRDAGQGGTARSPRGRRLRRVSDVEQFLRQEMECCGRRALQPDRSVRQGTRRRRQRVRADPALSRRPAAYRPRPGGRPEDRSGRVDEPRSPGARGVPNPDPSLVTRESRDLSFYRLYARYVAERGNGTRTVVTPYVGFGSQDLKSSYGATVTSLASDDYVVGLRASTPCA